MNCQVLVLILLKSENVTRDERGGEFLCGLDRGLRVNLWGWRAKGRSEIEMKKIISFYRIKIKFLLPLNSIHFRRLGWQPYHIGIIIEKNGSSYCILTDAFIFLAINNPHIY